MLYLPESFEWLILSSRILNDSEIDKILEVPSDYIDSEKYFSWERFFTELLIEKSKVKNQKVHIWHMQREN